MSVIIPCYNTAAYVGETLNSLYAQSFTDFEAIVVNDGSPDTAHLDAALAPFRERIRYIVQENRGLSGARNTAIRAARGEYVALLDSDDYWHPEYLATLVAELDANRDVDLVFPDARIVGDAPEAGKTLMGLNGISGEIAVDRLLDEKCFVFVGVVARRVPVVEAGLFDETLRSSEDFDLWLRLLKRGHRIGYRREVLAYYRRRADSLSANLERMFEHQLRVFAKLERDFTLTVAESEALLRRRDKTAARQALERARAAFARGEYGMARRHLREANRTFGSTKLRLIGVGLLLFPRLMWEAHRLRDRFVYLTHTLTRE